jgi:branched-chain amino acid transport system ATP-binding protein
LDQGFRIISAIDAASGGAVRGVLYRMVDEIFRAVKRNGDAGTTVLIVEGMAECPGISDHANMLQIGRLLMQGSAIETKVNPDVRRARLGL